MHELLFWLYLINSVLIINHEIDSAYFQEWKLFNLPGGIKSFLIIHFFILFFILYGLVLVSKDAPLGLLFSLLLGIGGIFAFIIHMYFLKIGRKEFRSFISIFILAATFVVSIVQIITLVLTIL